MQAFFAFFARLVLLTAGMVFAASLMVVLAFVVALWGLRYTWGRLTGRPISAFVSRINPRAGFGRIYRARGRGGVTAQAEPARPKERVIGDVTDVEPKPPRDHA